MKKENWRWRCSFCSRKASSRGPALHSFCQGFGLRDRIGKNTFVHGIQQNKLIQGLGLRQSAQICRFTSSPPPIFLELYRIMENTMETTIL